MLVLTCRVAEGIAGMDVSGTLGLLWLATTTDATALDAGVSTLGGFFLKMQQTMVQAPLSLPWAARSFRGSCSADG